MKNWTAKVDLNLVVNDQSSVTPNISFIEPLTTATLPLRGTFSRSFTLGLNAGFTGTAIRNETLSFAVSFEEMRKKMGQRVGSVIVYPSCNFPDGLNLDGNLGLREWIYSALGPVNDGLLTQGHHVAPSAGGVKEIKDKESEVQSSGPNENTSSSSTDDRLKSIDGNVRDINKTTQDIDLKVQQINSAVQDIKDKLASPVAPTAPSLDPPVDSISHQVQFIVVANAGVSPSWALVHFKGIAGTGPFAQVSQTTTHTLTIVIGAPAKGTQKGTTSEIERQLTVQGFGAQLQRLQVTPSPSP